MKSYSYTDAVAYIDNLVRFTVKHSNEHTRMCLARLGHPEEKFLTIHIAGTNGKGSVSAFLAAVLARAGRKCGLFTSPHLIRVNERMKVNGQDIPDDEFLEVFEEVRALSQKLQDEGEGHPSYFEFLFLMAMVWFARKKVDIAVVETGLGGRLDATNSLRHPSATVITSIGMDHMKYLGNTIESIASEKAGIIKEGVPCIYAADNEAAAAVISRRAEVCHAPAFPLMPDDYRASRNDKGEIAFSTSFRYDGICNFQTTSRASYQAENGALAVLTLAALKEADPEHFGDISGEQVQNGIFAMRWPGRMEEIRPGIFLDGAHNDNGIRRFLESVRQITQGNEAVLLFAVVSDKDFTDMIRDLVHQIPWKCVIVSEVGGERRTNAEGIAGLFRKAGQKEVLTVPDPEEGFQRALRIRDGAPLFVCGSLYLIGRIEELYHDQL